MASDDDKEPAEIRTEVQFSGDVKIQTSHPNIMVSPEDAILLGYRLISQGMMSQADAQRSFKLTVH